jgi:hypothetical protein
MSNRVAVLVLATLVSSDRPRVAEPGPIVDDPRSTLAGAAGVDYYAFAGGTDGHDH